MHLVSCIYFKVGDEHVREPISASIAGKAAQDGVMINIRDLVSSPQYAALTEKLAQQKVRSMSAKLLHRESRTFVTSVLCVPIMDTSGERVCGVIEVVNKKHPHAGFSSEDEEALTTFALIVGPLFEKSSLMKPLAVPSPHSRKSSDLQPVEPSIAEADDEDEEDEEEA
jgi:putative methionine-R-sulfoxide reductase with GAF domain